MAENIESASSSRLSLQLVCKAWREASLELLGGLDSARVRIDHPLGLFRVCKMLPSLLSLGVRCRTAFSLQPLSAYSRLSALFLAQSFPENGTAILDLRPLPSGLKDLCIVSFEVDPSHFEYIQCTQLTSLTFIWWTAPPEYEMSLLLDRLPQLEVRLLTHGLQHSSMYAFSHTGL